MTLEQLASAAATLLAPAIPFIKAGATKFSEAAGEAAWTKASEVWRLLTAGPKPVAALQAAADLVALQPSDPLYRSVLEKAVLEAINRDDQLAAKLAGLLTSGTPTLEMKAAKNGVIEGSEQVAKTPSKLSMIADGGRIIKSKQSSS